MIVAVVVAAVLVLIVALLIWWHETHRKCTGTESCRPGEGCTDIGGSHATYCGKCDTGTDCQTSAQYVQSHGGAGTTPGSPGCVNGKCAACTANTDCAQNYGCDTTGVCNQACVYSANCATKNCGRALAGAPPNSVGVCSAPCATYADCPDGHQCMSGACTAQIACDDSSPCNAATSKCVNGYCFLNSGT